MNGTGVIVLRLANHDYYEHATIEDAETEARRLAEAHGSPCVVYVPIRIVKPVERTTTEPVWGVNDIERGEMLPF